MIKITPNYENRKVYLHLEKTAELNKQAIIRALHLIGDDLIKSSIKLIDTKPKKGKLYRLKINGRTILHRASAAGEAPAILTGRLKRSLSYAISGAESMEFGSKRTAEFRGLVNYPKFLEEGTSKMAKRPYLEPAVKENEGNIRVYFNDQLKKALKK